MVALQFASAPQMPRERIVSPKGEALWAKVLGEPAAGFQGGDLAWSVSLLLDPKEEETIKFVERMENVFAAFHGEKVRVHQHGWPFADQTKDDGSGRRKPTGLIEFRFKRKELTKTGVVKAPPVVMDSQKNLWPREKLIGNGSKIRVAFSPWSWDMGGLKGMSLELEMVQVIDLVEYGGGQGDDPFDLEDGYVVSATTEEAQPPSFRDQLRQRAAELEAMPVVLDDEEPPF